MMMDVNQSANDFSSSVVVKLAMINDVHDMYQVSSTCHVDHQVSISSEVHVTVSVSVSNPGIGGSLRS